MTWIKKKCEYCETIFSCRYYTNSRNRKFCSRDCYYKYLSIYISMNRIGKNNPAYKGKIKKSCLQCGKEIEHYPSRIKKFCSLKCYWKYNRGKNNPAWRGNSSFPYTREYRNFIKKIYKRDNYKCRLCSSKGWKKLNVHHIYPKEKYPELTYDKDNCITLCVSCHRYFRYNEESFIDFFEKIMDYSSTITEHVVTL